MPEIETVRQHIAWSYANLARAHAAIEEKCVKYKTHHHMIRAKLYKGLCSKTLSMRTIYDDERLKMTMPQSCVYCGSASKLCLDHLIPRNSGGDDNSDNLIWACNRCNSSKSDKDMLSWHAAGGKFPSILLLRRYLKIIAAYCEKHELMETLLSVLEKEKLPFSVDQLPTVFPDLSTLVLWVPVQI